MPTQTGSVLQFNPDATNTGTVSSAITVPDDAQIVLVAFTGQLGGTSNIFSGGTMTFTKGGTQVAMTAVTGGDASATIYASCLFYLVSPDTGTNKTLNWDWLGTSGLSFFPKCSVTFWKDIDIASPVRSVNGVQSTGLPYTSGTLTAQSGDLIVAYAGGFVSSVEGTIDSWSNLTLLSQLAFEDRSDGAWATGSPSGNTTVAASTSTNITHGALLSIVLKPAAGSSKAATFYHQLLRG